MNNTVSYPLEQGRFINRFIQTPIIEKIETFKKTIMDGKINDWLKYGFAINDNPCRREFIDQKLEALPPYVDMSSCIAGHDMSSGMATSLYFPFGNVNVDHSGFWHVPTSLTSYYVTWLDVPEDMEDVSLRIFTPGGATVWLEKKMVASFRPFTRNLVKETLLQFDLKQGLNMLTVCLEDFAERDTDYYFRLELLDASSVKIRLPLDSSVCADTLLEKEALLSTAWIHQNPKLEPLIRTHLDNTASETFEIETFIHRADMSSRFRNEKPRNEVVLQTVQPGENELCQTFPNDLAPGYYNYILRTSEGNVTLTRKLATQFTKTEWTDLPKGEIKERKATLLELVKKNGADNCYKAVALLAAQENLDLANRILLGELPGIRSHGDCSDFYLIAHLYAYQKYRHLLSPEVIEKMEDAILTFRYWIDEPGNDVMWFFSENHALGFHACQYIAGKLFPNSIFSASGLTGKQAEEKARKLLSAWFDSFDEEFMTEWNSNAYLPIDATAFGFLMLMIDPSDPLYARIIRGLDRLFFCMTLYSIKNTYISSYGRSYEKQLKGNLTNGPSSLLYLGYGTGCFTADAGCYVPLCLSSYAPPEDYARYMKPSSCLWYTNNQGYYHHVNLSLYKTDKVLLSTANAFKPYMPGYQEHISEAAVDAFANVFVNHPGETCAFGSGRPSYWAGNGYLPLALQWQDFSMIRYKNSPRSLVQYTHAYFPFEAFDRVIHGSDWYAGEKDGGYVFVWAANGLRPQTEGAYCREELISNGIENCWILRVSDLSRYTSLESFAQDSLCTTVGVTDEQYTVRMAAWGEITLSDQPIALLIDGKPVPVKFESDGCLEMGKDEKK